MTKNERLIKLMGLFSNNYDKVGPGISKNPNEKAPFFKFFEIYFSHFSKMIILNLLFIIALLPFALIFLVENLGLDDMKSTIVFYVAFCILGSVIGPAMCGVMRICRNIATERPVFIWHDFWKAVKTNLKQGLIMGLIDSTTIVLMSFAIPMYFDMAEQNSLFYVPFLICLVCAFIFVMMHFYIYLFIVSTTLSLWKILKNSFYLTAIEIKTSIANFLITVLLFLIVYLMWPYSSFAVILIPSLLGLLYAFNNFPAIRKYVIQPYYDARGEQNPEFAYLNTEEESVFTDTPETEEPPVQEKKPKGKNKTIR